MKLDFHNFAEYITPVACVVSVEKFPDGSYGNIRIASANSAFTGTREKFSKELGDAPDKNADEIFDEPYDKYIPKDVNFENFCYRSAILGQTVHTYVHPEKMPVWLYITAVPLKSDKENIGYCAYIQEMTAAQDYSIMTNISPDVSANVLQICLKLHGSIDFMSSITEVICDIRDMCDAEHCCILTTDFSRRKCAVLCEALSQDTKLLSMEAYVNDDFFGVIDTWHGTMAGSNYVIIKNSHDWEYLRETNPVWYNSINPAGAKSIVLFPLVHHGETLGFIWAINFNTEHTLMIKETLELATYFLASELSSHQLFDRLRALSSSDLLTGVLNRNAMNNRVDGFTADKSAHDMPVCVIFADLNGLKRVNDTEGHFAGDLLLKDAALTLQKHFPEHEVYRAGGDEFMVLALEPDEEQMLVKIQHFRDAVSGTDGVSFAVGWSFGRAGELYSALREADELMYADKEDYYRRNPDRKR